MAAAQMFDPSLSRDHLPKHSCSLSSTYSSLTTRHTSMSTDSFSPIIHSSSSLSTDDNYETSSPVNEADEVVLRTYYPSDPARVAYTDGEGTSLWHDLDRDGVNTPAIPSFILNSPPLGPVRSSRELRERLGNHPQHEITTHSLRKGISLRALM
jgi:hypothetical protein